MWYKIDSINHEKFSNFKRVDDNWCGIDTSKQTSVEEWDFYINKPNRPFHVWFYEDAKYMIYYVFIWSNSLQGWACISYGSTNKRLGDNPVYEVLDYDGYSDAEYIEIWHIQGQALYDWLTTYGYNKIITKDFSNQTFIDNLNSNPSTTLNIKEWIRVRQIIENKGEEKSIYESYGLKITKFIDSMGTGRKLYELI